MFIPRIVSVEVDAYVKRGCLEEYEVPLFYSQVRDVLPEMTFILGAMQAAAEPTVPAYSFRIDGWATLRLHYCMLLGRKRQ